MLSMVNGGTWQKAKISPYKHTISAIAVLPSKFPMGFAKNLPRHSAIMLPFNNIG